MHIPDLVKDFQTFKHYLASPWARVGTLTSTGQRQSGGFPDFPSASGGSVCGLSAGRHPAPFKRGRATPPCDKHPTWQVGNAKPVFLHLLDENWVRTLLRYEAVQRWVFALRKITFSGKSLAVLHRVCCSENDQKRDPPQFACVCVLWRSHSPILKPTLTDWVTGSLCDGAPPPTVTSTLSPSSLWRSLAQREPWGWTVRSIVLVRCLLMREGSHSEQSCYLGGLRH